MGQRPLRLVNSSANTEKDHGVPSPSPETACSKLPMPPNEENPTERRDSTYTYRSKSQTVLLIVTNIHLRYECKEVCAHCQCRGHAVYGCKRRQKGLFAISRQATGDVKSS